MVQNQIGTYVTFIYDIDLDTELENKIIKYRVPLSFRFQLMPSDDDRYFIILWQSQWEALTTQLIAFS